MKIRTVSFGYGETRSVNFKSRRIDVSLSADLVDGDVESDALAELERRCVTAVRSTFDRMNAEKPINAM